MAWQDNVIESAPKPWSERLNEPRQKADGSQEDVRSSRRLVAELGPAMKASFGFLTEEQQAAINMAMQDVWARGYGRGRASAAE